MQWGVLRLMLVALDVAMLALGFALAFWLRFNLDLPILRTEVVGDPQFYRQVVFAVIPAWLVIFAIAGLYREQVLLGGTREYALAFNAVTVGIVVVVLVTFLSQEFTIARAWLVMAWMLSFFFVALGRFGLRRVVYWLRTRGWFLAPTLIVGTNDEAQSLAEQLGRWRSSGLFVVGLVAAEAAHVGERIRDLYVVGTVNELGELVRRFDIAEVVVATSAVRRPDLVEMFRQTSILPSVRLRLSGGLYEVMTTGLSVKELAFVPLIEVQPARLNGVDWVLKVVLDYGLALAAVVLLSPLYLALALAVKLDSPGPVLYRRRVLGMGGREFDALKFRSMHVDGEGLLAEDPEIQQRLAEEHKLKDDPRVTRLGKWLRKLSLDELPQFLNVLRGEMSVVGPRMISPEEHALYGRWDMNLLTVKPGITGLWQVSGRSDVSYDERVRLDMNYIRNWTIWQDLHILLLTVPAVVKGKGAY